jgi:hypothetical protein
MGLVGDGTFSARKSTLGQEQYYYTPESDDRTWTLYNSQTFSDGPMSMTFDAQNSVVLSSNWNGGVWKLVAGHSRAIDVSALDAGLGVTAERCARRLLGITRTAWTAMVGAWPGNE